jgi:hypothetical protein
MQLDSDVSKKMTRRFADALSIQSSEVSIMRYYLISYSVSLAMNNNTRLCTKWAPHTDFSSDSTVRSLTLRLAFVFCNIKRQQ